MFKEDPAGVNLASIIVQDAVEPVYSGGAEVNTEGVKIIEGVHGAGDKFMVARASPEDKLPSKVKQSVQIILDKAIDTLGPVKIEWVYDGNIAWVLQIHRGATTSKGLTIFPGEAASYIEFEASMGIEALRDLIAKLEGSGQGIRLLGNVGVTSHFGDLLRRGKIPSKIVPIGNILNQTKTKN
jgi:hypothetical protein